MLSRGAGGGDPEVGLGLGEVEVSFRAGQRRLAEGLRKLVKGKVKKKRSPTGWLRMERIDDAATTVGGERNPVRAERARPATMSRTIRRWP